MGKKSHERNRKKKVVIILSPHPDDLELSTTLLCSELKKEYTIIEVVLTDGAAGGNEPSIFWTEEHVLQRKREARKAAMLVGVSKVIFLDYPDGKLKNNVVSANLKVKGIVKNLNPEIICFPSRFDLHPDHQAAYEIARLCMKNDVDLKDFQYCFWGKDERANYCITLDEPSSIKESALQIYVSQPIKAYMDKYSGILKEEKFYSERM